MKPNEQEPVKARFAKLSPRHAASTRAFTCEHADTNEFVQKDVYNYDKYNLGVSYVIENEQGKVLSLATIGMGSIKFPETYFLALPVTERPNQLPALKIGRLCTAVDETKKGYAKQLVQNLATIAIELTPIVGCKYLLVDAYIDKIPFYEKLGFQTFIHDTTGRETVLMFIPLPDKTS